MAKKKKQVEESTDKKYEIQSEISMQKANYENLEKRTVQLKEEISNGPPYTINGITYDDGSNVTKAVETLVRAAKIERRL